MNGWLQCTIYSSVIFLRRTKTSHSSPNKVRYRISCQSVSNILAPLLMCYMQSCYTLKRKWRHFDEIFITGCTGSCHFDNFQCSQWRKRKCRHFDEIFITGCTGSCHFDNFQCSQWWKFHQNEDISISVYWNLIYQEIYCNTDHLNRWLLNTG